MILYMAAVAAPLQGVPPPANCTRSCHGLQVPYPFGLDDGSEDCYLSEDFSLTCNSSHSPPKLLYGDFQVEDIMLSSGQVRYLMNISYDCYNSSYDAGETAWNVSISPFALSYTENVFVAVGCDTEARFKIGNNTFGGCMTRCNRWDRIQDGKCSGIGCCQTSIPERVVWYETEFEYRSEESRTYRFNNCSYAFLVEKKNYTFRRSHLKYMDQSAIFPFVLDWYVGNQSCEDAEKNRTGYACVSSNSRCLNSINGPGYICNCSPGFQGNPYLEGGCQDIDECAIENRDRYPCKGICRNTVGNYNCTCPEGFTSRDAKRDPCDPLPEATSRTKIPPLVIAGIGTVGGILLLLVVTLVLCVGYQRRKNLHLRRKFFERNGGVFLERALYGDHSGTFKIFTRAELEAATKNFDRDLIVGHGGFGEVYKGFLEDGTSVAVKRAMTVNERNGKEFANEIMILSKVNHKNTVKLLGCCLESKIPMLVYEYIPGGTLHNFLHDSKGRPPMSFNTRVRIASEAATALRYLHLDASPPICHGDIKTSNILLDDGHVAKISDFGTSTLVAKDRSLFKTMVQGTCGYMDPEYVMTGQLTFASDVFSFGVVLAELLTGRLPFDFKADGNDRGLANLFLTRARENRLDGILDRDIVSGGVSEGVTRVVEIALRCLNLEGDQRPTMKEVEAELEGLWAEERHPWERTYYFPNEADALLEGIPNSIAEPGTEETRAILAMETAR